MGCLNVVMFSPEDLRLVKDGPGERRRFMDVLLCQIRPAYFYALSNYQRALSQRNALLKEVGFKKQGKRFWRSGRNSSPEAALSSACTALSLWSCFCP